MGDYSEILKGMLKLIGDNGSSISSLGIAIVIVVFVLGAHVICHAIQTKRLDERIRKLEGEQKDE